MVDKSDQIKEVFECYGETMFFAQALEERIPHLLVAAKLPDKDKYTLDDIKAFLNKLYGNTLGKLVGSLREKYDFTDSELEQLQEARRIRNELAHGYFPRNTIEFQTVDGRIKMVEDLRATKKRLQAIDTALSRRLDVILYDAGETQGMADRAREILESGDKSYLRP